MDGRTSSRTCMQISSNKGVTAAGTARYCRQPIARAERHHGRRCTISLLILLRSRAPPCSSVVCRSAAAASPPPLHDSTAAAFKTSIVESAGPRTALEISAPRRHLPARVRAGSTEIMNSGGGALRYGSMQMERERTSKKGPLDVMALCDRPPLATRQDAPFQQDKGRFLMYCGTQMCNS
jgi:hypothetical protein